MGEGSGSSGILSVGRVIANRFQVIDHIGHGGYGEIYSATDLETSKQCAVKVEDVEASRQALCTEIRIISHLKECRYFPKLIASGLDDDMKYMALTLLGPSLSQMRRTLKSKRYSSRTTLKLALEMVYCIEEFHRNGYVHRDIKPGNFLLRPNKRHPVCLVDFGLSKSYIDAATGKHVREKKTAGFTGTCSYASLNAHKKRPLSRRDDMFSWFYSVIDIRAGRCPWPGHSDKHETINLKLNMTKGDLCTNLPAEFQDIWRMLTRLGYYDVPDYVLIRRLIRRAMSGLDSPDTLDWEGLPATALSSVSAISLDMADGTDENAETQDDGLPLVETGNACGCTVV